MLIAGFGPSFECGAATVWFWITCLSGLVWLKRHIDLNKGRNEPVLRPDEPGVDEAELPPLSMLVAAKDGGNTIRTSEEFIRGDQIEQQIVGEVRGQRTAAGQD